MPNIDDRSQIDAWLTEYTSCGEEATLTANAVWTSTSIFVTGWGVGLLQSQPTLFRLIKQ